jgi:dihydroflavonol-4-reductase
MITAVTGATGHVGANLVRALLAKGRKVRVLVRNDFRAIEGLDLETVTGDVLDPDSLMKLCRGADTVFHAAARISIVGSEGGMVEKINVEGPRNVVEACLRNRVKRLVHFSSIHAYSSDPADHVIDETRQLALDEDEFPYDKSKAMGQREVLKGVERGLNAIIINPTAVLGPHDYKISRMGDVLLDIYNNRYPALIDGGYNWVDARDVVDCALAGEEKGRSGESYLASGTWRHICDISRIINEIYCIKTPRFATPMWVCTMPSYVVLGLSKIRKVTPKFTPHALRTLKSHRHISHEKATRELGYKPRPLEDTIRDTLDWFRQQGMIDASCAKV